jgi:non-ribosomal peptide synthetase-like protein
MLRVDDATQCDGAESAGASVQGSAPGCLHELFERQADARGNAVALVCGEVTLSYSALELRANRLANHLRQLGVVRGALVGIAFDRSELPIIAILACLKAGAAYVPIDPSHPDERIRFIVEEAEIAALLTERAQLARISTLFSGSVIALDDAAELAAAPASRPSRADTGLLPHDLCYVIYTSGTTGRPKGVLTEHRNAVHFVRAFNKVCKTIPEDRVYQGFSLGFDGSVEEMWMAFSNGATLVVASKDAPRFGNDLARHLGQQRVTYFSTVPTMLTTMTEPVPSLRQLVVSGEVCQPQLVERWAVPGRLMLNAYGPTEATVNATAAVCRPGHPITIGRPLEGYEALVLDGDMRPLPQGAEGELYIAGAGIARGYLKRPDLTESSFVISPQDGRRLYRTGDLACINANGEVEYFGRIDRQVKIRGYRVEPAEIEAVLLEQPHVSSAVAHLHEHDAQILAAYVVLNQPSAVLDRAAILAALRARLPAYMVPAFLDVVAEVPMLASGKVDRKCLPAPASALIDTASALTPPVTPLEASIAAVWATVFRVPAVGVEQNFFLDLGGHSLLAAQMTALLRSRAELDLAVRDVYSFPTVRELAQHVAQRAPVTPPASVADQEGVGARHASPLPKPGLAVTLLQSLMSLPLLGLALLPLIVVVPLADDLLRGRSSPLAATLIGISLVLALWPAMLALSIAAKWLIIGRYRAGAYPLWGSYYLRWWLVARLQAMSGAGLIAGTPLMSVYYRLMGAKVGRDCALDTALCSIFDLVSIGDDTSIGAETQLPGYRVENGFLLIGRVDIGSRCFIGVHSALGLDVRMGDDTRLDDQSLLPDGAAMAAGERRRGAPAQAADVTVPQGRPRRSGTGRLVLFTVAAFGLAYLCVLFLAAPALGVMLLWMLAFEHGATALALLVNAASLPLLVAFFCVWVAALKALLLWRATPGVYDLYSTYYLRHWLAYGLMRASRGLLLPVFTTLYLPPWMRLLGARIGAHAEMSTVWCFTPELLAAGDGSFFADGCFLGGRRSYGGRFELRTNHVGSKSFVGNSAILPPGAGLGDNCLLGVLSAPPSRTGNTPEGTDWLGSPAFALPNRHKVGGFDERRTFSPTPKLYAQRAVIDACRILVPAISLSVVGGLGTSALLLSYERYGSPIMLAMAPLVALAMAGLAVAIVVALKWAVMGKFKPVVVPLWCPYVWLNEMVNGAYESLMAPVVSLFFGTPFAAPLLRLLGCRIGRYSYIATSLFSEFDLVAIGDHVALNSGAVIQNHLFEDRIMKSSYLRIDDRCSVGNMAVVLYDGHMQSGAVLGPLSLLMKGEIVPPGTRWHGIPTVKV